MKKIARRILIGLGIFVSLILTILVISWVQYEQFTHRANFVEIEELISRTNMYEGKNVCTTGFYWYSWEATYLAPADNSATIWVEEADFRNTLLTSIFVYFPLTTKRLRTNVCGKFEVGKSLTPEGGPVCAAITNSGCHKFRIAK